MNILWITNILFPEVEDLLTGKGELEGSGGWLLGAANGLLTLSDIKLTVATVSSKVRQLTRLSGKQITYYVLPLGKGNLRKNPEYMPYWQTIQEEIQPDVVHIHGTECSHGLAYMEACGTKNVVISIQGLTSSCYHYYTAGLSIWEILSSYTLRDLIKGGILHGKKLFKQRSNFEQEMIKKTRHVIGRTQWDCAHVWAINPGATYHCCNETLRDAFYDEAQWEYEKCNAHTIFLSQASYPIKGLHMLLKAMPYVLRHFPDTQIRVGGGNIFNKGYCRRTGYAALLKRLMGKTGMQGKIVFTAPLDEEAMKREYLSANLFLCPSSIENSSNSLGEAQILGVPCIASYVGGMVDTMREDSAHLYRFDDVIMLAKKICDVFSAKGKQVDMRKTAKMRHDKETNTQQLMSIYKLITEDTCVNI